MLVTLAFGYGIYEAFSYAYLAKIFPLYISLVLCGLAIINLIQEIRASRNGVRADQKGTADLESEWGDLLMSEVLRRFSVFVVVIIALYALVWLIGYPLGITLFIIILYRYISQDEMALGDCCGSGRSGVSGSCLQTPLYGLAGRYF